MFVFNAAVSPDRLVNGSTKAFGSNMVLGYNTSSSATFPAIRMISKQGDDAKSSPVTVVESPGPDIDFGCAQLGFCPWGDYAAATPDPNPNAAGIVWLTSMWTRDGTTTGGVDGTSWKTLNWAAHP